MYSPEIIKRFTKPKFMKVIKNPDGYARVGSEICGDEMEYYIKIKDGKIDRIGFQTFGCAASIATSDMLAELAIGKTLDEAKKIAEEGVIKRLKGFPQVKFHCANLATKALKAAINNYESKKK